MSARRAACTGLAAAVTCAALLAGAPAAMAAGGDFTWTGAATPVAGSPQNWADAGNWSTTDSTDAVPTTSVDSLTFPAYADCGLSPDVCYGSDNLGALTVGEMTIDDGTAYTQYTAGTGNTITLNGNGDTPNVGLETTDTSGSNSGFALFDLPVALGAAQQWNIPQGTLDIGEVAGSVPLTLNLGSNAGAIGGYLQVGELDTGATTVEGAGDLELDSDAESPGPVLPSSLTLQGDTWLTVSAFNTTSGPIDASATSGGVQVYGAPGTTLAVSGALTLGSSSELNFVIDGDGAGQSTSLTATSVDLGGTNLALHQDPDAGTCETLTPGTTHTLLTTTGTLSGDLIVDGTTVTSGGSATESIENDCGGKDAEVLISYGAQSITATIVAAPAAGASSPQISGGTVVGDTLKATGTGTFSGYPTPSYTYQWLACASGTCTPISGAIGSSYQLVSANVGKSIELRVTATNAYGSANADSNALGPVTAPHTSTPPPPPTVKPGQIRSALKQMAHPTGARSVTLLLRRREFRSSFMAPASGTLSIVWRARVATGRGRHRTVRTYVIARASAKARQAGRVTVSIRLTATGVTLLREHRSALRTTTTRQFRTTTGVSSSYTMSFML